MSNKKPIGLKPKRPQKKTGPANPQLSVDNQASQFVNDILSKLENGDSEEANSELAQRLEANTSTDSKQIEDQTHKVLRRMEQDDPSKYRIGAEEWKNLVKGIRNGDTEPLLKRFLSTNKLGPTYLFATNVGAKVILKIWERRHNRYINLPENSRITTVKQILSILVQSPIGYHKVAPQVITVLRQHLPSYEVALYEESLVNYVDLVIAKQNKK